MEPLRLPRGSVRAIVTVLLVVGAVPVAIFGNDAGLALYGPLVTLAVRDYFAHREQVNRAEGPQMPEPVS